MVSLPTPSQHHLVGNQWPSVHLGDLWKECWPKEWVSKCFQHSVCHIWSGILLFQWWVSVVWSLLFRTLIRNSTWILHRERWLLYRYPWHASQLPSMGEARVDDGKTPGFSLPRGLGGSWSHLRLSFLHEVDRAQGNCWQLGSKLPVWVFLYILMPCSIFFWNSPQICGISIPGKQRSIFCPGWYRTWQNGWVSEKKTVSQSEM